MDRTPRLDLPYILAAQAQKHVTHNEALRVLDILVQPAVLAAGAEVPPADPGGDARFVLGAAPVGDWAGHAAAIAFRDQGAWQFLEPQEGWAVWVLDRQEHAVFQGGLWRFDADLAKRAARLGVGTAADEVNRLAVAGDATLLTHGPGGGHQVKVNKAAAGGTASLVFQTSFSGRAEMGTVGSDAFAIKVSADGSAFAEGLRLDPATGAASLPAGARLPDGSAAVPALRFEADGDTGLDRPGADQIGLVAGGVRRATVSTAALTATVPLRGADGSAAAPAVSFSADTDTGVFRAGADVLGLSAGGAERARVTAAGMQVTGLITGTAVTQSRSDRTEGRLIKRGDAVNINAVGPLREDADGSPLLAVIDSGQTPNGSFTRWADGTLVARHRLSSSSSAAVPWDFPHPFAAAPVVTGSAEATGVAVVCHDATPTARAASLSVRDAASARLAVPMLLTATGRWKDDLGDTGFIRSLGAAAIYDFTNMATLWQDSAGTTPVTAAGQPIGLVHDLGAGARHLTQATSGQRPQTATNEFGRIVGAGDGTDDVLNTALDLSSTSAVTVVMALRKATDPGTTGRVLMHGAGAQFSIRAPHSTSADVRVLVNAGSNVSAALALPAPVSVALVARMSLSAPVTQITQDGSTWVTSTASPGAGPWNNSTLRLFASTAGGGEPFGGQIAFAAVVPSAVTDAQAARLWRIARGKWGFA